MTKKSFKLASTIAKSSLMPLSGFTVIKTEYNLSEEDSSSSNSPSMVETTSPLLKARGISPPPHLSPQSKSFLNTKMLLTSQNLSYIEQKLNAQRNSFSDNQKYENSENFCKSDKHINGSTASSTSLFTIDSILSKQTRYNERSPSMSPINDNLFSKNRSVSPPNRSTTRLPPTALFQHHHPNAAAGLHITHLATNFGSPEFLGKYKTRKKRMSKYISCIEYGLFLFFYFKSPFECYEWIRGRSPT